MSYHVNIYHLLMESVILSIDSIIEEPTDLTFQSSEEAADYLTRTLPILLKQLEKENAENLKNSVKKQLKQMKQMPDPA